MKPQISFFSIFFFVATTVFGQDDIGFKATVTSGFIAFKDVSRFQASMADQKNLIATSGQIGMFYSHSFSKRSSVETDLLFNQVESRTTYIPGMQYDQVLNDGVLFPFFNNNYYEESRMHLSYLSLPVYFGFKLRRFTCYTGFQTSLKLATSYTIVSHSSGIASDSGSQVLTNIDNLDFGPKIGLTWRLSTYLILEGNWYYGLNNITHDPSFKNYREYRIRQIGIGIRYILTRNY